MKFLRLYEQDGEIDENGVSWNIPLEIEHESVGLSSIHVTFKPNMLAERSLPRIIPIQCSLIKENMWNSNGVFYNLDLSRESGYTFADRMGIIGK